MWSKKGTFVQVNIEWPQTKTFQFNFKKYIVDVLWGQPIKLIQLMPTNVQNFMNIDGTTLILIIWSPWVSGGPQKPQILTASTKFYAIH